MRCSMTLENRWEIRPFKHWLKSATSSNRKKMTTLWTWHSSLPMMTTSRTRCLHWRSWMSLLPIWDRLSASAISSLRSDLLVSMSPVLSDRPSAKISSISLRLSVSITSPIQCSLSTTTSLKTRMKKSAKLALKSLQRSQPLALLIRKANSYQISITDSWKIRPPKLWEEQLSKTSDPSLQPSRTWRRLTKESSIFMCLQRTIPATRMCATIRPSISLHLFTLWARRDGMISAKSILSSQGSMIAELRGLLLTLFMSLQESWAQKLPRPT